jgi:1-acyl-sn-glycerol-3-phosphate acyltransferase
MTQDRVDFINIDKIAPEKIHKALSPVRSYFSPVYHGLENIDPDKPYLFVCNHTMWGFFDTFLLCDGLLREKNIYLRGMGDHVHFSIPYWGDLMYRMGGVPGTRENCRQLMQAGENIGVYPGGGREIAKRRGEAYKLFWYQRTGFVRMAMELGYNIIPVAAAGAESIFSIVYDTEDIMASPVGKMLERRGTLKDTAFKGGDYLPPLVRGIGPTIFPRPERIYFSFGKPIGTKSYKGKHDDEKTLLNVQAKVADSISSQIRELLVLREQDTDKRLWRKFLTRL